MTILTESTVKCGLQLKVADRSVLVRDRLEFSEGIYSPTSFFACIECDPDLELAPGDPVELTILSNDLSKERTVKLWCASVSKLVSNQIEYYDIFATDILGILERIRSFTSYKGKKYLSEITKNIVSAQISGKIAKTGISNESPFIKTEWLFQCNETSLDFIRRLAREYESIVFYDGEELKFGRISKGVPGQSSEVVLEMGKHIEYYKESNHPEAFTTKVVWTDPLTLEVKQASSNGANGAMISGSGINQRVSSAGSFLPLMYHSNGWAKPLGIRLEAKTVKSDIKLGDIIKLDNGSSFIIESIDHFMSAYGTYENCIHAVDIKHWGIIHALPEGSSQGPYLAEVYDNRDPKGNGRIRLKLLEDSNKNPTSWIPSICPAAGKERGWYWIPEIGDRVWITSSTDSPERIIVIGSVRGNKEVVPKDWCTNDNTVKILKFRKDLEIRIDEKSESIILNTKKTKLVMNNEGQIKLDSKNINENAEANIEIRASGDVNVDGARINLG